MELPKNTPDHQKNEVNESGLDQWNDRLDENLEPENHNDVVADERAKEFSEKEGSGDQSDESDGSLTP